MENTFEKQVEIFDLNNERPIWLQGRGDNPCCVFKKCCKAYKKKGKHCKKCPKL